MSLGDLAVEPQGTLSGWEVIDGKNMTEKLAIVNLCCCFNEKG